MGREERTGGARDSTALQPPGQQDLLVSCIAEEVGAAKAASYAAGYADGWMAYANAIQPGLQQMAQAILAFGSNKYEMLRNLLATGTSTKGAEALKATRPPPPPWCRTLKVSTLPPLEESRATEAAAGARANALHLEEVRVGGGTIRVPSVALQPHDSHGGGWCNAAHCMVAAVLQAPDPTLFTTVHTKAAYAQNATAQPGTDEDAVEGPFKQWSQGKLKMTLPNLRQYAASLGITSTGGRKSLLKNITAHLAVNVQHAQQANLDWSSSESEVNTDSDEEIA
jgi:hypothetical protein